MRVLIIAMLIACSSLCSAADEPAPPPPSPEQIVRVRKLVQSVQAEATVLQARLDQRQRELGEVYTVYELDEVRAQKLQAEIVELQRLLLANHHRMQAELRVIVSRERFEFLRKRLANFVTSPGSNPETPEPPGTSGPSTHERSTP
jgi:hypothetical protein